MSWCAGELVIGCAGARVGWWAGGVVGWGTSVLSLVGTTIGRHHNPQRPVAAVKPENLCAQRSPNPLNLGREALHSFQTYKEKIVWIN